ncbi:MAG TPA: hypothetical protein VGQ44_14010 [Gemmatimonadaceae bacterium]|nr:hypothetical protein [Gemmatimonadaceae bacterium]
MTPLTRAAAAASTLAAIALLVGATPLVAQRISTVPTGQPVGGISCDEMEGQRIHIHQHLLILDRGKSVDIPNNVGRPLGGQCLYWVHTHTPDGVIHIESPANRTFTLGDFFAIWGQPLSETRAATAFAKTGSKLKVWVDGKPYSGDPAKIPLLRHTDVVIEAGPPFSTPPRFTDWQQR